MRVLRWIVFALGALVLLLVWYLALVGAEDLKTKALAASWAFRACLVTVPLLIAAAAMRRHPLQAAGLFALSVAATAVFTPEHVYGKASPNREVVLIFFCIPSALGSGLALLSVLIANKATARATTP